ncbi:solute carrier family 2, facilitated glucose transporter member 10-like isoform X1 [Mytilus galloprovincialis]|uniref:solute carrier family 2, facilitated glucose transporter member 10-like isoform X1 n=1 Tax=Mytilus galloprovincialis TaxID=29158 RepID=UPI003F7BC4C8
MAEESQELLLSEYCLQHHDSKSSDSDESPFHYSPVHKETSPRTKLIVDHRKSRSPCGSLYVLAASVMASLGGILFGYDIGIISGAILQLKEKFCLSCFDQELVVSSMLFGALLGSCFGGMIIDWFGRRFTIIVNAGIFTIGAVIAAGAPVFYVVVIGRVVLGFAVSVSAIAECIYISEIAPAKRRGLLVSLNELGITCGLLIAYLVNYACIDIENGWRYMFVISVIPAVIQGIGMIFLPPSPRFLMLHKQESKAEAVLLKLRGGCNVEKEIDNIRTAVYHEKNTHCCDIFSKSNNMRGRLFIGAGLVFFQQFTGQPNVLYYASTILQAVGFHTDSAATLATVGLGGVKVLMTIVALLCVDRWGRRKFLLVGATLMGISLLVLGLVTHYDSGESITNPCQDDMFCQSFNSSSVLLNSSLEIQTHVREVTVISNFTANTTVYPILPFKLHGDDAGRVMAFTALLTFVAAYGFSFGPISWLVLSEIFPSAIRGRAIALTTTLNWGTNLVISAVFLDMINGFGVSGTFFFFSSVCVVSVIFIFTTIPETKGKSLEQISEEMNKRSIISGMKAHCFRCLRCFTVYKTDLHQST